MAGYLRRRVCGLQGQQPLLEYFQDLGTPVILDLLFDYSRFHLPQMQVLEIPQNVSPWDLALTHVVNQVNVIDPSVTIQDLLVQIATGKPPVQEMVVSTPQSLRLVYFVGITPDQQRVITENMAGLEQRREQYKRYAQEQQQWWAQQPSAHMSQLGVWGGGGQAQVRGRGWGV